MNLKRTKKLVHFNLFFESTVLLKKKYLNLISIIIPKKHEHLQQNSYYFFPIY